MDRWTCPHCRREFNQRTNLRRHLRTACPELVSIRPYSCERGCGSRFYRPDMRDRHQRHCSHTLIGQVQVEDPDALEVFASDEGLGGGTFPTEQSSPPFLFLRGSPLRRPPECIPPELRGDLARRAQEDRSLSICGQSFCFVVFFFLCKLRGRDRGGCGLARRVAPPRSGTNKVLGGGVAPAGFGAVRGASTVPYGAGWLPPLVFQRPAIFPPRACAVHKTRPHGCRTFERVLCCLG